MEVDGDGIGDVILKLEIYKVGWIDVGVAFLDLHKFGVGLVVTCFWVRGC